MPNVILRGYIIVPPDDLTEVQRELPNHIEKTLEEEGCLIFSVTQDSENKFKFNVHEEFMDQTLFLLIKSELGPLCGE